MTIACSKGAALPAGCADALIARSGPCAPYRGLVEAIERSDLISVVERRESTRIAALNCIALLRALAAAHAAGIEDPVGAV